MQGWLEPIGPEEPRVYWMRRAIVLAVAVAVIAGIIWLFGRPRSVTGTPVSPSPSVSASASRTPSPSPSTPTATPTPAPETVASVPASEPTAEQPTEAAPPAGEPSPAGCQPAKLTLRVEGTTPLSRAEPEAGFHVVVSTTEQSCQLDLAASAAALAITSGTDEIWSTNDCAEWHPSGNLDLAAGQEGGFDVSWPIKRADGCELSDETLGAGTYVATASIGQSSARFVMQLQS